MSIAQFIENLQKKPEKDRQVILWIMVSVIFGVIFFVWVTTFDIQFALPTDIPAEDAENQISPFESLKAMVSGVSEDIGKGYDVLTESISVEK